MNTPAPQLAKAALWYARHGYPVFPCAPRGKIPLTEHGCKDATTDPAQVRAWWQQWPRANIGVATGDLTVLDVDPEKGGARWLDSAPNELLPPTPTVQTGSGGWHKWYLTPPGMQIPNSAGRIAPGIDVRSTGGYVIAPPSIHPNGTPYTWAGAGSIAEQAPVLLPAPLAAQMLPPALHLDTPPRADAPTPDLAQRKLTRALDRQATEGRNNAGFWLACQLRDNGFGEMDAEQVLLDYQRRCPGKPDDPYLPRHALESVKQAYRRPARAPDPDPPAHPAPPPTAQHLETLPDWQDVPAAEYPALLASLAARCAALETDLAAERAAHTATQARLTTRNEHIRWTHEMMSMPNVPPGEKITMYFARWQLEYAQAQPQAEPLPPKVEPGMVRLNLENLAVVSGQSPAAVGRHIKHASEKGILRRRAVQALAETGERRTQVYVYVPPAFFTHPRELAPEERANWGGKRERCAACGSTRLKSIAFRCQDCGHEQAAGDTPLEQIPRTPPKRPARPPRPGNIGAMMAVDKPAEAIGDISPEAPAHHLEKSAPPAVAEVVTVAVPAPATALQLATHPNTAHTSYAPQTRKRYTPAPLQYTPEADTTCWLCREPRPCRCDVRNGAPVGKDPAA